VPCAQRQEISQEFSRPVPSNDKVPAHQIPRRGHEPQPRRQRRPKCHIMSHLECGGLLPLFLPPTRSRSAFEIPSLSRFLFCELCVNSFFFLYVVISLLLSFIRCAEKESHPLPALRTLFPPTALEPSPAPPPSFPRPANHSTSQLPRV